MPVRERAKKEVGVHLVSGFKASGLLRAVSLPACRTKPTERTGSRQEEEERRSKEAEKRRRRREDETNASRLFSEQRA